MAEAPGRHGNLDRKMQGRAGSCIPPWELRTADVPGVGPCSALSPNPFGGKVSELVLDLINLIRFDLIYRPAFLPQQWSPRQVQS